MQQKKPFPLRMPDDMRETIEAIALNNGRSLNAEILRMLESSLSSYSVISKDTEQNTLAIRELEKVRDGINIAIENIKKQLR